MIMICTIMITVAITITMMMMMMRRRRRRRRMRRRRMMMMMIDLPDGAEGGIGGYIYWKIKFSQHFLKYSVISHQFLLPTQGAGENRPIIMIMIIIVIIIIMIIIIIIITEIN